MKRIYRLSFAIFWAITTSASAQWVTETIDLQPGWNGIYLHVDGSHEPLAALLERLAPGQQPIAEIWQWAPSATSTQFVDSPSDPGLSTADWLHYQPTEGIDQIGALSGNTAYLIHANSFFTLEVTGRPLVPSLKWDSNGLNFNGFSTPPGTTKTIDQLFAGADGLLETHAVYKYAGSSATPIRVLPLRSETATRGKAFWFDTDSYSRFTGPFSVTTSSGPEGLDFGPDGGLRTVILSNNTSDATTLTLTIAASAPRPDAAELVAPAVAGPLNLVLQTLLQGETHPTYTPFFVGESDTLDFSVPANSTLELRFAIDRATMFGAVGDVYQSIITMTDASGLMEVRFGARGEVGSRAGLYIGEAQLRSVASTFHRFARTAEGTTQFNEDGEPIYVDSEGVSIGTVPPPLSESLYPTADTFPLRILLHIDAAGTARLLSSVFIGPLNDGIAGAVSFPVGLTTRQDRLDPDALAVSSRLTAGHLPPGQNYTFTGSIGDAILTTQVLLAHDAPTNPFLHTYHPDHDNLDARFESVLGDGEESYSVARTISLSFDSNAVPELGANGSVLSGQWTEVVSGLTSTGDQIAAGPFILTRIAPLESLETTAP